MSAPAVSAPSIGDLEPLFGPEKAVILAAFLVHQTAHAAANMTYLVYVVGSIILIATGSRRPWESLYQVRLSQNSQNSGCSGDGAAAEEAAAGMAASGLTVQPDGSQASCFHCGAAIPLQEGSIAATLEAGHQSVSPHCYINQLNKLISSGPAALLNGLQAAVAADAERFSRALRKLAKDLASRVVSSAESYGFSRNCVTFAAARHFMQNGGSAHERPGSLIGSVHQCLEEFGPSAGLLELFSTERLLDLIISISASSASPSERLPHSAATVATVATTAATATATAVSAVATSVAPAASARAGTESVTSDSESSISSDRCVVCRRNTRDRVALPCAHFVACATCLSAQSRCPVCGSSIVATIRAFVS